MAFCHATVLLNGFFWIVVLTLDLLFENQALRGKSANEKSADIKVNILNRTQLSHKYHSRGKLESALHLLSYLLKHERYDQNIRPVFHYDQPVKVAFGLNLYQILNIMWDNEDMGWDPVNYEGINWTTLPYNKLWRPDTTLYNGLQTKERSVNMRATTSAVEPNATKPYVAHIRFMYPALYKFSCNFDVQYFPFDRQNCSMIFGSWTMDGAGIDYRLHTDTVRFESYVPNEAWSVISFEMVRRENYYTCCPFPYIEIHAHLVIQRKPLYYIVNLVIPIIIIVFISIFGLFNPVSSGGQRSERVELGVSTLLAMSILLVIIADKMPKTSDSIPLISNVSLRNLIN